MGFTEDFLAAEEKRKKKKKTGDAFTDEFLAAEERRGTSEDYDPAPVKSAPIKTLKDIAPVKSEKRSWFDKGAFEDGYQFGDILSTIADSATDLTRNIGAGVLGIGESAIDAGAYLVGGVGGLLGADEFQNDVKDFISKDIINEKEIAKWIVSPASTMQEKLTGKSAEENSIFGDKSDSLAQSGGQLLGTIGLQAVGVPWFVTSGVTSFGSSVEGAFNDGASYAEAGLSGAISAGAEMLTEKLFGGSGLGEKGLINLEPLTKGISNKVVKALANLGVDMAAEGSEEVVSSVASRLGSALYKEENLSELLLSEEAVDEYIESFIGGAALGGVMNTGKTVKSIQTGRDYRTGLTESEQKVFDSEYNNRLAEEEKKAGKNLTAKEKAKVYDSVLSDLEKGYISTDTITDVLGESLGGDSFKAYQGTVNKEDAILKEFDELGKKTNPTLSESARYSTLSKMVEDIKANSQRGTLKANLGDAVATAVKGTKLVESYNEQVRRGQAFEADLSKYDSKQAAIVQKAIDSGILNNTNRTHDFVDMVSKISADKGVLFDFANNAKLKESGFALNGKTINGFVTKDGVTLNIDAAKSLNTVVGHEITHVLEGTELYTELSKAITEYAKSKGDYQGRYDTLAELYKDVKDADIDKELTSDLVGDYLFTDQDFVNSLSTEHRNIFEKIYDEIKYLCKMATAGSKEARELEKVKRAFEQAYKADSKASGETKYSLGYHAGDLGKAESYGQQGYYRDTGHFGTGTYFVGDEAKISDSYYGKRPHHSVEFDNYNLYKIRNDSDGTKLHRSLKAIDGGITQEFVDAAKADEFQVSNLRHEANERIDNYSVEEYDEDLGFAVSSNYSDASIQAYTEVANENEIEIQSYDEWLAEQSDEVPKRGDPDYEYYKTDYVEYLRDSIEEFDNERNNGYEPFRDAYFDLWLRFGKERVNNALQAVIEYDAKMEQSDHKTQMRSDSRATVFMKALGYEGIDTRGSGLDNTAYGSVIYDLKGDDLAKKNVIGTAKFSLSEAVEENNSINYGSGLDNQQNLVYNGARGDTYARTDEFRNLQAESQRMSDSELQGYHAGTRSLDDLVRRRLSRVLERQVGAVVGGNRYDNELLKLSDSKGNQYNIYEGVNGALFHDCFEISRKYLKNGELVDLHTVETTEDGIGYDDCYNYLSADGLSGFSITPDGDLISVFNASGKNGFLRAISDIVKSKAKTLDCYASPNQNLMAMYEKVFGFKTASVMDYNMDYDHDNIAENHGMPQVAFMVNSDSDVETKSFTKDQYDEAVEYRNSFVNQATSNKVASFMPKNADVKYSLSADSQGRKLSENQERYFKGSKVVDENGNLKAVYHGSPSDFNEFSLKYLGTNGTAEGYGFYFTDSKRIAEGYSKGREGQQNGESGRLFEVYLDIKKPLSDTEVTMSRSQFRKLLIELNNQVDADGEPLEFLANYGDVEWEGLNKVLNYAMEIEYDGSDSDVNMVHSIINACGDKELVFDLLRKVTGYDGIIVNEATWGGDQTIYIAFHPEQIKNVDNLNPTNNPDIRKSLSTEGSTPKQYGNWNIRGEDVALAPTQEEVAPVADTAAEVAPEAVAPTVDNVVDEAVDYAVDEAPSMSEIYGEEYEPIENAYTVGQEIESVQAEMKAVYEEYNRLKDEGKDAEAQPLFDKFLELNERGQELYAKAEAYKAEDKSAFESLTDADDPGEVEAPYSESNVIDPFEQKDIKDVGNPKVKAYMYENPEVKPFFQEEANILLGELNSATKGERGYTATPDGRIDKDGSVVYGAESYGVFWGTKRDATADIEYLLDQGKNGVDKGYTYDEIRDGLNAIIEDNGKENNACSKRIEFIINDRLMNGYDSYNSHVPANQEYRNLIKEKGVTEYNEEAKRAFFKSLEADIAPVADAAENIAPTYDTARKDQVSGQQTIFEEAPVKETAPTEEAPTETEAPKIAEVLPSTPKTEKKVRLWQKIKSLVFDKQSAIEDISLKTKNRELMGKADFMLRSESRAQRHIKNKLMPILEKVEATGDRQAFETYAYHLHNIDRMSLEGKSAPTIEALKGKFGHLKIEQVKAIAAKKITDKTTERTANTIREAKEYLNALETKNKPVFADEVTADKSREFVKQFEAAHPEAKAISEAIIEYNNELRQMLVDGNVISQETADLWAEMYPHYVPIRRAGKNGAAVKVPLDSRKTGVNAPIARATGGNSDMESLLDVMGSRTEQVFRSIARNNFGLELMHTIDTVTDKESASIDEILDSFDNNYDELLKKGENGANPTFTVFENGERVTFDITEELYDALKPTDELLKTDVPIMSHLTKLQRGLLTQYNPTFIVTNAFKDIQDVLVNSQHARKTYANVPLAIKELVKGNGKWIQEYMDNGGEDLTYFDSKTQTFKKEDAGIKKVLGFVPDKIAKANDFVEKIPRLAEYIASRKSGASVEVAMLDAARVTTNFAAGGDLTKFANKNGFTFLNASVQGAAQQVRNIREAKANGLKGTMQLAAKFAVAGLPIMLFNALRWNDDEEYAELSDYVKDNYYIVAKTNDGKFVRIPKGRAVAVIQSAFEQMQNLITGDDEVDMARFGQLLVTNLAPNDPLENNVIAPIMDVKNNETWYGEALVPQRLQNLPDAEQYDETTDSISKWLGEVTGKSPYKINYLLDQYSGGVGDVVLPMLTPESDGSGVIAPFTDKFTTDSTMKNQNVSDFYETVDELTKAGNSADATDDDILKSKYINSVSSELGELYAQKREIQNSDLSDKEKDAAVRDIQAQIVDLTKTGLSSYEDIRYEGDGEYAVIGDRYYQWYTPKNGEAYWRKLDEDQVVKYNLTKNAGGSHYVTDGNVHYRLDEDGEWTKISDRQLERQNEVTKALGITPEEYWSKTDISFLPMSDGEYEYAFDNPEKYSVAKAVGGYDAYKTYSSELYNIRADKDENGKSISGSRKEKVLDYINNLDADYGTKIILFKSEYNADDTYNHDIIEYLNSRDDISYEEMETILKELGFTVDSNGNISWD